MKKVILFAAILFAGVSVVKAEGPASVTGNANSILTVKLAPFQHIDVSGNALIEYKNQADYKEAATVTQTESESNVIVKVSSAGGFTVSAKAEDLKQTGHESHTISSEYITVSAEKATENSPVNTIVKLSNLKIGGSLIKAETGGMDISYKLNFVANGADFYRIGFDNGLNQTEIQTYTTTVVYSVIAS